MGPGRRKPPRARSVLSVVAGAAALAASGCGSGGSNSSSRSSVSTATSPADTTPAARPPTSTAPRRPHTTSPGQPSAAGTGGAQAPGAGAAGDGRPGGRSGALATVARQGYRVADRSTYRSDQTLRVLIGSSGRMTGRVQRAFFFLADRYLGTDASTPSAGVSVITQDDTSVTLSYRLFRPRDPLCCPSGGRRSVRFVLDNGKLMPNGQIPTASPTAPLSRR